MEHFTNSFSEEIWDVTYKHHSDNTIEDTWRRVANNLASIEKDPKTHADDYYDNLLSGFKFVAGGRILSNAGTEWKASYINCFVNSRAIYDIDSLDGIMEVLRQQAQTLKSEGGWGCNFSFIRPRGSFIKGIGVESVGAVSYMTIFDRVSEVITASSGTPPKDPKAKKKIRKGAMMAVLDCTHPDIFEFITAKQQSDTLSKFNMSVGCYNEFMDKVVAIDALVKAGKPVPEELEKWDLIFPDTEHEAYKSDWYGDIYDWKAKGYPVIVYKTVSVSELWEAIMKSTYNRNEPGVLFLDRANETHCWNYGEPRSSRILASNPCGEQLLPDAGCCNLGSFNLTQFVNDDLSGFDYPLIKKSVKSAVRFLDSVNDLSYSPLEEYSRTMVNLRRIGLGVMGWGSSLMMLRIRFGSKKARAIQEELMKTITHTAIEASIDLAEEKGAFDLCDKDLHWQNQYFKNIELPEHLIERMKKVGIRNSSLFSIQPTGNTGILANLVSGGLEPVFMPEYIRTSIVTNAPKEILDKCPKFWQGEFAPNEFFKMEMEGTDQILVYTHTDGTKYKIDKGRGLTVETLCVDYGVQILKDAGLWDPKAEWAATTTTLTPQEHIDDMVGFAKYLDSAASKTLNFPNNFPFEDFKDVYLDCYKTGVIKGFTTYRDGTMTSVLKSVDSTTEKVSGDRSQTKRPKTLDADIYIVNSHGGRYVVAVGLIDGIPYEVFGGVAESFSMKKKAHGTLTKVKRGQYSLQIGDIIIEDFSKHFTPQEQTLFRMVSTSLRHGVPIEFVVEQMQKGSDDMFCLPSAISRVLKKYIKDGKKSTSACPSCGGSGVAYVEGCKTCKDCGWSACG